MKELLKGDLSSYPFEMRNIDLDGLRLHRRQPYKRVLKKGNHIWGKTTPPIEFEEG